MDFIFEIRERARKSPQTIILPESTEERTLKAASIIISEKIANVLLLGKKEDILQHASQLNISNIEMAEFIDHTDVEVKKRYIPLMLELRAHKGLTEDKALASLDDPLTAAAVIIKAGDADGEVAGAINATGDVLRPAFQFVKTIPGIKVVSGAFIMLLPDKQFGENGMMVFADCAVHPDPDAEELAEIAISSYHTAKNIAGIEPVIAMLSFSTKGSASHPLVDKVVKATEIVKNMHPEIIIDGDLQADAAIIQKVGDSKAPGSKVAGRANVLVFPNLESGNISYKLVQRMAGAQAIGPVLQGMAAPINDLSRGCSVDDIINLVAITSLQASGEM